MIVFRYWGAATIALGLVILAAGWPVPLSAADVSPPRLLVLVVFDQLRGDYLLKWHDLFGPDGFRRLEREGTWFTNCYYPYACTMTAPGHASLLTGCSADRHGVILNEWRDRSVGASVYCVTSDRYQNVYSYSPGRVEVKKNDDRKEPLGATPDRMLAPSFGDVLKDVTGGRGKIVALSLKDRSAVLPGGHRPDACYWLDTKSGQFITSTYYRNSVHGWVTEFNRPRAADRWFHREWTRSRDDVDYVHWAGADDAAGEGTGVVKKQGKVFPHPMNAGLKQPGRDYYETLTTAPFGNDLLLELATRALEAEQLGRGDTPDLLTVSFSANDLIGHAWGPDSQEVLDVTLRSDLIVRDLLATLDRSVGHGRYLLALSADHGICPVVERTIQEGRDARRVEAKAVREMAIEFLNRTFGASAAGSAWIEQEVFPWTWLNYKLLAARGLQPADVADALAAWFRKQPYVLSVYTRRDLEADAASLDEFGRQMKKSYHPQRSGDVAIVTKPYYLFSTYATGTAHGSPHTYDRHVPLLFLGPGIPAGRSDEAVTPQTIAPVFARAIAAKPPAFSEAAVPRRLSAE